MTRTEADCPPPPRDLLIPYVRPVRRQLVGWATGLIQRLDESSDLEEACEAWNESALVVAHAGYLGLAQRLCERQLAVIDRCTHPSTRLRLSLQPWINLGRLAAIRGDGEVARRRHFSMLGRWEAGLSVEIGARTLTPSDWRHACAAFPSLRHVLLNVEVIDTLKSWLVQGDLAGPARFLSTRRGAVTSHPAAREVEVLTLVTGRSDKQAFEVSIHESRNQYLSLVLGLHLVPALRRLDGEIAALDFLNCVVASPVLREVEPVTRLRFFERVTTVGAWTGSRDLTAAAAKSALKLADDMGDEVSAFGALSALARLGEPVTSRRDALRATSDYRVVSGTKSRPNAVVQLCRTLVITERRLSPS